MEVKRQLWFARGSKLLFVAVLFLILISFMHCTPPECRQSADCSGGAICQESKCVARPATSCASDKDCSPLEVCVDKKCKFKGLPQPEPRPEPKTLPDGAPIPEVLPEEPKKPDGPVPVGKDCVSDGDCQAGVCAVSFVKNKVVKTCAVPKKTAVGEKCSGNAECSSGLCPNASNKTCVSLCAAHRHCPTDYYCSDIPYLEGNKVGGCLKGVRKDCSGDQDCAKGLFCQVNFTANGVAFQVCGPPEGNDKEPPGTACTPDDFPGKCASHVCDKVLKTCLEVCKPGLPCQNKDHVCQVLPYLKSEVTACYPLPKACERQADCPATTTCRVMVKEGKAEYLCMRNSAKASKQPGDRCDTNKPQECASGLCVRVSGGLGMCVETCKEDADCTADKTRNKCGKVPVGDLLIRACLPDASPCSHSAICPASQPECLVGIRNEKIIKECGLPRANTKKLGEVCTENGIDNNCGNRFCERGTLRCVAVCDTDKHCPEGLVCREAGLGKYKVKGCVRPLNSVCKREIECVHPETCRVSEETDADNKLKLVGRCKTLNAVVNYSSCTPAAEGEFTPGCRSAICSSKSKTCVPTCVDGKDCFGRCEDATFKKKTLKICNPICAHRSECQPTRQCSLTKIGNTFVGFCAPKDERPKKAGDACDIGKGPQNLCESRLCGRRSNKCLDFCRDDKDCSSTQVCASAAASLGNGSFSAKACVDKPGSCAATRHCAPGLLCQVVDHSSGAIADCLQPDTNRGSLGVACTPGGKVSTECQSGICEPTEKVCTILCDTTSDCTIVGYKKCEPVTINGVSFKVCNKQ